jgi:hypothetical protein
MLQQQAGIDAEQQSVDQIIAVFNACFSERENTRLERGDSEPIYLPAGKQCPWHRVIFAHGFFNSAMHEIAHWLIAGQSRRLLEDYGYWYAPDGRSAAQQKAFEQVEVKPQALEWLLMKTVGRQFRVSVDNLSGEPTDTLPFMQAVCEQARVYCRQGLSPRAQLLQQALAQHWATRYQPCESDFQVDELLL